MVLCNILLGIKTLVGRNNNNKPRVEYLCAKLTWKIIFVLKPTDNDVQTIILVYDDNDINHSKLEA